VIGKICEKLSRSCDINNVVEKCRFEELVAVFGSNRVAVSDEKLRDTRTRLNPPRSRFRIFNLLGAALSQDCAIKLHKSATFEKGTCVLHPAFDKSVLATRST